MNPGVPSVRLGYDLGGSLENVWIHRHGQQNGGGVGCLKVPQRGHLRYNQFFVRLWRSTENGGNQHEAPNNGFFEGVIIQ